ncbi:MAG: phosphatase PAP2 family protein [Bacteroidia bacterium]
MNLVRSSFYSVRYFLMGFALLLLLAGICIASTEKLVLHGQINGVYSNWADWLFLFFTWVGDGITCTIFLVLFLFVRARTAWVSGIAAILASGITYLLKTTAFYGEARPILAFQMANLPIRAVPGLENNMYNTFPSGHTTLIFAVCCSLAFHYQKTGQQLGLLLLAACVGFSRVYLSQHFMNDIFAGALIGTATALCIASIANHKFPARLKS